MASVVLKSKPDVWAFLEELWDLFCLSVEYKKEQYGRLVNHYPNMRGPLTGKRELFLTNIVDNLKEDEYVISNTSACFYFFIGSWSANSAVAILGVYIPKSSSLPHKLFL